MTEISNLDALIETLRDKIEALICQNKVPSKILMSREDRLLLRSWVWRNLSADFYVRGTVEYFQGIPIAVHEGPDICIISVDETGNFVPFFVNPHSHEKYMQPVFTIRNKK